MDWLFPLAINVVLTIIKEAIDDEGKKEKIKRALIKVRNAIDVLYLDETKTTKNT